MKTAEEIYYKCIEKPMLDDYKRIVRYLKREAKEGKQEFRLVLLEDNSFYIHPLNKDGETFDGKF